ncbi:PD-(D/E)XK nuclease family protein, partial [Candidatus Saccharibacteria bacterium]|nr:PD-(D/E)XK nuclease family protein [Candidatus Saccharibacteria bacterium]
GRMKYLDIREDEDGALRCHVLPADYSQVQTDDGEGISLEASQDYWSARHEPPFKANLHTFLMHFVKQYQLSATHVNKFIDVTGGGPREYLLSSILQFPKAVPYSARYGTAIHETIRYAYQTAIREKKPPSLELVLQRFEERLNRQKLATLDHELFLDRGRSSLTAWLAQKGGNFKPLDRFEFSFRHEASFVGLAHLSGNVDRMRIDPKGRTITVTDFKTGQPYHKWVNSNIRLYKYRQQLLFYKLLIESSRDYKSYRVETGIIEFVEPDEFGNIVQLELDYDDAEVEYMRKLIQAIWQSVQNLDFPDISAYPQTVAGIKQFEEDLIKKAPV